MRGRDYDGGNAMDGMRCKEYDGGTAMVGNERDLEWPCNRSGDTARHAR